MDFKNRAKNWDNDKRIQRSKIIAEKIDEIVGEHKDSSIMEYGCATGLISFNLIDKFRKLTLMDSEEEMINIVKKKVIDYKISNVFPVKIDLTNQMYLEEKFDLIYTSLTIHHILDIEKIIKTFYNLLNPKGTLFITELDKEDGSFHINHKNFNGHNGFQHEVMEQALANAGFSNIKSETFFYGKKTYKEKVIPYSMFYTIGKK